ncbi:sarcoplasmic/endoplasmic reticulum calcium ATPase regulator DWORF isoform X1 [Mirounga angustirostris]|uniref:Sarcoplasmic/endoplasmic reticulum calcium ATPase regulator DWORF n=1 Tax=Neomonachus schauinslandi TaxID=29088 RepID=A0A2Y9I7S1_NEOSC|nr:sarcoplasmic/endoplasmic reticulum calcium ATPase regulator DWORF [Neomonachus schauinslandi]XP_034853389.1 sarcoplasmic/endoplasmic reticulum calcium ATPase regulator DWORF isoform X1 [Mirounga leonina]XP_034853399.1 sarcoplasmic/endoplasmic reticulum calcium ATPase regulator DWORF isoform X1 [Mirounga leonina]XP_045759459.1 sarcoplasmic/endoplasmic reticulum calcium ATPase regulator DWORF isoform X1 [Mirounga angustirostris]XP_045759460.1 sarcoplasmic/endoplasmic reticulum calcium ATPase r
MAEKAESASSRLLVPILLLIGWIVGCIIMVYVVFS